MLDPPRETSFGHLDITQSSQVRNPIIGRILVGNPNSQLSMFSEPWCNYLIKFS